MAAGAGDEWIPTAGGAALPWPRGPSGRRRRPASGRRGPRDARGRGRALRGVLAAPRLPLPLAAPGPAPGPADAAGAAGPSAGGDGRRAVRPVVVRPLPADRAPGVRAGAG